MRTNDDVRSFIGQELFGPEGSKIGKVENVYVDDATGQPEWFAVKTGFFKSLSFVPIEGTETGGGKLTSRFDAAKVKGSPHASEGHLSPEEEQELYRWYGVGYDTAGTTTDEAARAPRAEGYDTSGPTTDDAMTRSEEHLVAGTTQREAGVARLRKWVDTERETATVTAKRDEVRVEREPITDANVGKAMDGPAISEETHEVPLFEEEVVANTEVVPKERVRLTKETVAEEQQVAADVRKERIEVEGGTTPTSRK